MAEAMQAFKTTLTKKMSGDEVTDLVVGNLTSLGGVKVEGDEIETTDFDSQGYKEFISGFKDAGEVPIEGNLKNETTYAALSDLVDAGTTEEWTIEFKSGATLVIQAWLKSFGTNDGGMSDAVTFGGSLRVSGKPVFTAATS